MLWWQGSSTGDENNKEEAHPMDLRDESPELGSEVERGRRASSASRFNVGAAKKEEGKR